MNKTLKHFVLHLRRPRQAFSLIELLVALGIIAALAAIAIPSIKAMQKSFDSTGAESMIGAALSTARTIAIKEQKYAGVRFQKAYVADSNKISDADQYMIFIIKDYDMQSNMETLFRAIPGYKPMKLPTNTGITDMQVDDFDISDDDHINDPIEVADATTFSIVFSPSGKIVTHKLRVRNKAAENNPTTPNQSDYDDVFNSPDNITKNNTGLFVQDDYDQLGYDEEQSRKKFKIYDSDKLKKMNKEERYTEYLEKIKFICLNPYTGEIVKKN